jgi:hypothetical protein
MYRDYLGRSIHEPPVSVMTVNIVACRTEKAKTVQRLLWTSLAIGIIDCYLIE